MASIALPMRLRIACFISSGSIITRGFSGHNSLSTWMLPGKG